MEQENESRPDGYTALTPYLVVDGADAAITFYTEVFGATLVNRLDGIDPDGRPYVGQAELDFGGAGRLQLSDPQPAFGLIAPDLAAGGVSQSIVVYVADVDATVARAAERGVEIKEQPSDFVSGDRFAAFVDPFGRRWSVLHRDPAVDPDEAWRRVEEWWQAMPGAVSNPG